MDQDTVVNEQIESGQQLIDALVRTGFPIRIAFWAKPTDEGKWFLYLASPQVDEKGPTTAYRQIHQIMRSLPGLWIDPFEVRVVGLGDSLAQAALTVTKPRVPDSPFAVPQPHTGMTRVTEASLGGVSIDGALIYPPPQPVGSP